MAESVAVENRKVNLGRICAPVQNPSGKVRIGGASVWSWMVLVDMTDERDATDDANSRNALCVASSESGRIGVGVACIGVEVDMGTAGTTRVFIINNPMIPAMTRMTAISA